MKLTQSVKSRAILLPWKQVNANIGNLLVSLTGKASGSPTDESADITFSIVSSDLSALGKLNGDKLPSVAMDLKADYNGNTRQFSLQRYLGYVGGKQLCRRTGCIAQGSQAKNQPDSKFKLYLISASFWI